MLDQGIVDLRGLSKAEVLAALYNAASPLGKGFLPAAFSPGEMTVAEAEQHLAMTSRWDYLNGRSFKVDLSGDQFDPWLYDRDNGGPGTAEAIIERLRSTGAVTAQSITEHREGMTAQHAYESPLNYEATELIRDGQRLWREVLEEGLPTNVPKGMTARRHLDWSSDQALAFYDRGSGEKAILVFLTLVLADERTAWIAVHTATPMILNIGVRGGRGELERAMKGFAA